MKKVTYMEMIRFQDLVTRPERGHKLTQEQMKERAELWELIKDDYVAGTYHSAFMLHSGCTRFYRSQYKAFWGDPERDSEALAAAAREARVTAVLKGKAVA